MALPLARRLGTRRQIEKFWQVRLDQALMRGFHLARKRDRSARRTALR